MGAASSRSPRESRPANRRCTACGTHSVMQEVQVTLTLTLTLTLTQHLRHPQRDADERGDGGRHPGHLGEDGVEDADSEEERAWLGLGSGLGLGLGLELGLGLG